MTAPFIHLHVHSAYSLAEGAIKVKDLVKTCIKYDMPAVAITDTNNLFGAMELSLEASKAGVQPIVGVQLNIADLGQIVLLVQREIGYRNLSALVSIAHLESRDTHQPAISMADLTHTATEGLICLSGGIRGGIGRALLTGKTAEARTLAQTFLDIFGDRFYIEIQRHHLPDEQRSEECLLDIAYDLGIPIVATNDAYFLKRDMHLAHDALLCIAAGRYISETDRRTETPDHYFKTAAEMEDLFSDLPEAIENTSVIARRCGYILKTVKPLLPPFKTESGRSEVEELRAQAYEGLGWRLENYVFQPEMNDGQRSDIRKQYEQRLEYELGIIIQMGFPGYFLIVSDFIKWAKNNDIPVGPGRGSGVGSLAAWSLKITDLDPIPLGLLFERFLNPERVSMPDFDVDFCQDRRDEVIKYVQERYGSDHVAQIITFGKLQARAVVRDVGRVLQMPYGQVDRIAKMIPQNPTNPVTLEQALEADPDLKSSLMSDETSAKLVEIALQLEGMYRHASTHAAGIVIGDRPLTQLVALYRDPKSDIPATQFNMKFVEQTGLVKYDFLGLKNLTVIKRAINYVRERQGIDIDILKIPLDDPEAYKTLNSGNTTGLFQVESAGMRDAIKKIRPSCLEDIIAILSLYRPGPMDNIPVYGRIKEGKEEPDYIHPKLEPVLKETYGIMVYQEQVMEAAKVLCGYTLGGADLLRRAMGKKIKAEMDAQRSVFVKGAVDTSGLNEKRASEIFDLIAKFADYGFNKSHAAAYALITYQTCWMRAHYPLEFMAALMTLDRGNTDKLAIFKQAADHMGIPILPPDINTSDADFQVQGDSVRYALSALKGVGDAAMRLIVAERSKNGPFKNLSDFLRRIDPKWINRRQIEVLAAAGAFESLHPSRAVVYGAADHMLAYAQRLADERTTGQASLFGGIADTASASDDRDLALIDARWDPLEKLQYEFDAIGFYLSAHPLDSRREQLENMGIVAYADLPDLLLSRPVQRVQMAGVVIRKQEKMSKSGKKFAFMNVSDATGVYEVTVFSEALAKAREYMTPGESLLIIADAEMQDDIIRVTAQDIKPLDETLVRKVRHVVIELEHERGIPQIQKILQTDERGMVQFRIKVPVGPEENAVLMLPDRYAYAPKTRDQLYQVDGLIKINEK